MKQSKLIETLTSKKFLAALLGCAWQIFLTLRPDLDTPAAEQLHTLIVAYILGTAIVDHAKASTRAPAPAGASPDAPPPTPPVRDAYDVPTAPETPRSKSLAMLPAAVLLLAALSTACTPASRTAAAGDVLDGIDKVCAARAVDRDVVREPPMSSAADAGADGGAR